MLLLNNFRFGASTGYQPNQPVDLPTVELPSNARGVPTAAALSVVLRHAQRLLGSHAVAALSVRSTHFLLFIFSFSHFPPWDVGFVG